MSKVKFKRCGSYIESSDWIKNNTATINPKTDDDKCLQYATTVVFNHEEIKRGSQRISKIEPFINK